MAAESRHWEDDGEETVCRKPVQRHLRSMMKILMMYYMDIDMVSEAKGEVSYASEILA